MSRPRSTLTATYRRQLAGTPRHEPLTGAPDAATLHRAFGSGTLPAPVFVGEHERRAVARDIGAVYDMLRSLPERLYDGRLDAMAHAVGLTPRQVALVLRSARSGPLLPLGRADLYHDGSAFRLLELNVTSALGGFEVAGLNRAFLRHRPVRSFVEQHGLQYADPVQAMAQTLLAESSLRGTPFVVVLDTSDNFAVIGDRLRTLATLLAGYDVDAQACHPGALTYPKDRPTLHGRRVDVVLRYFLVEDLEDAASVSQLEPLVAAAERGDVLLCSRLDAEIYGNKGTLAALSDNRNRHAFSAAELACVDRLLPWTRFVRPQVTDPGGDVVETMAYARAHRSQLVLKPTLLHGGSGVIPGWQVGEAEWVGRLTEAMSGPYVLQQRVRPSLERCDDQDGHPVEMAFNWGIYFGDADVVGRDGYAGCLVRAVPAGEAGVISMAGGARVGCAFYGP